MKKTALSLLSLSLVFVMLFALVACGGGDYDGTYVSGEETLTLKGDKWTVSAGGMEMSGTFKVDGSKITFNTELLGEEVPLYSGTIDGNTVTVAGTTYTKK